MKITQELLQSFMSYDAETGIFTWLERKDNPQWNVISAGKVVGSLNKDGYLCSALTAQGKTRYFLLHRAAWLYTYGVWPSGVIDHINHIKTDNRITNLRDVNSQINRINVHPKYEAKGYCWNKNTNRWQASIMLNGQSRHLGSFDSEGAARLAYLEARRIRDASLGIASEGPI